MSTVKYPNVTVDLGCIDGNAFSIMGAVKGAMLRARVGKQAVEDYINEAMSGDYDNLLQVTMRTVNVECSEAEEDDEDVCDGCGWYVCDCRCGDDDE